MAQQMLGLQSAAAKATPEQKEKMSALKSDPELKLIFDDIEQNGPGDCLKTSSQILLAAIPDFLLSLFLRIVKSVFHLQS